MTKLTKVGKSLYAQLRPFRVDQKDKLYWNISSQTV